ncbi:MAG: hypothetical protein M1814_003285 [Vezdaea aestivalis]|nr:MAG: hypothetical protein M1814_003285 [Vezdaea aestivalis]
MADPAIQMPEHLAAFEQLTEKVLSREAQDRGKWSTSFSTLIDTLQCERICIQDIEKGIGVERPGAPRLLVGEPSPGLPVSVRTVLPCFGTFSKQLFTSILGEKLGSTNSPQVEMVGVKSHRIYPIVRLKVLDIPFSLCYLQDFTSVNAHNCPRDLHPLLGMELLAVDSENSEEFLKVHRILQLWASERGLISWTFGLLDEVLLAILLRVAYQSVLAAHGTQERLPFIISHFFIIYNSLDLSKQHRWDRRDKVLQENYRTSDLNGGMRLVLPRGQDNNLADAATSSTCLTMTLEIERASKALACLSNTYPKSQVSTIPLVSGSWVDNGTEDFLSGFNKYLHVEMRFWATSRKNWASLIQLVQCNISTTLRHIDDNGHGPLGRPWPYVFVHKSSTAGTVKSDGLVFLIGYNRKSKDTQTAETKIAKEMDYLAALISSRARGQDLSDFFVGLKMTTESGLKDLKPFEGGEELQAEIDALEDDTDTDRPPSGPQQKKVHHPSAVDGQTKSSQKQRPASDVLSRLRWDPAHDMEEYVIGYIDRFDGVQEMKASKWAHDTTEEEFIPQHRILYFKHVIDGVIVWDRKQQVDKIFRRGQGS